VVKGYWNNPQATDQAFSDGWFHTGDIGRIDDDGCVYIVDRKKDMIIRGGENVYCAEVEAALLEHPSVKAAAVIGLPHRELGEEVAAVVQVDPARPRPRIAGARARQDRRIRCPRACGCAANRCRRRHRQGAQARIARRGPRQQVVARAASVTTPAGEPVVSVAAEAARRFARHRARPRRTFCSHLTVSPKRFAGCGVRRTRDLAASRRGQVRSWRVRRRARHHGCFEFGEGVADVGPQPLRMRKHIGTRDDADEQPAVIADTGNPYATLPISTDVDSASSVAPARYRRVRGPGTFETERCMTRPLPSAPPAIAGSSIMTLYALRLVSSSASGDPGGASSSECHEPLQRITHVGPERRNTRETLFDFALLCLSPTGMPPVRLFFGSSPSSSR
jgi:hypothetical protein